jgi:hypothetical protein
MCILSQVFIVKPPRNSLNNRFIPYKEIRTDCVFSIDDDFSVNQTALELGFAWWQVNPYRLVGFYPRRIEKDGDSIRYVLVKQIGQVRSESNFNYFPCINVCVFVGIQHHFEWRWVISTSRLSSSLHEYHEFYASRVCRRTLQL